MFKRLSRDFLLVSEHQNPAHWSSYSPSTRQKLSLGKRNGLRICISATSFHLKANFSSRGKKIPPKYQPILQGPARSSEGKSPRHQTCRGTPRRPSTDGDNGAPPLAMSQKADLRRIQILFFFFYMGCVACYGTLKETQNEQKEMMEILLRFMVDPEFISGILGVRWEYSLYWTPSGTCSHLEEIRGAPVQDEPEGRGDVTPGSFSRSFRVSVVLCPVARRLHLSPPLSIIHLALITPPHSLPAHFAL